MSNATKKKKNTAANGEKIIRFQPRSDGTERLPWFFAVVTVLFLLLIGRLFYVQVLRGNYYREKGERQWVSDSTVAALRGAILDRNESPLAQSATTMTVVLRPGEMRERDRVKEQPAGTTAGYVAETLSAIIDMDREEIYAQATRDDALELWLKRQISIEQEKEIREKGLTGMGVGFAEDCKRFYIRDHFLSQTLGYTNIDGVGQEGLEASYNNYLMGSNGEIVSETTLGGMDLPFTSSYYVAADNGYDLVTTIDYVIQSFTEQALTDAMAELNAEKIEAIVMDPDTAEIYAMAQKPDMDNNDLPRDDMDRLLKLSRNSIIADSYEPGSTFKVITAASALDMGLTNTTELFGCTGKVSVEGDTIKCWRSYDPHGTEDLKMALRNSCNPVFVTLALRMGTDDFYGYIRNFGFGQKTGIDLYGEAAGILTAEKYVRSADLARIGFGQSIAVTPVQMAAAVSAVINGGRLMQPYLVSAAKDQDGNIAAQFRPTMVRQVISESTSRTMRELLQFVVDDGVPNAQIDGVAVGGKTGTAQKYDSNGQIMSDEHVSSFVGFLPADDPELLVLVIVDGADVYADSGAQIAAPVAREIMEKSYHYLHSVAAGEEPQEESIRVPDITGMTRLEASEKLSAVGLTLVFDGDMEYINAQIPAAGMSAARGSAVNGYALDNTAAYVVMPDVCGMKPEDAQAALLAKGLVASFAGEGKVETQSVEAGRQVRCGSVIELKCSK